MVEASAARVVDLHERHVREWDRDRDSASNLWNDRPWIDRFIALIPAGASVLDLGCGWGWPVARHLAASGLRVTGVGCSPTLLSLARERLPNQEWRLGDMRRLNLSRAFDALMAWDSFFHLIARAQRRMFACFARHATPSATLMFNTGPERGEAIGEFLGDPLYHASLGSEDYRALLEGIGFEIVAHVREDLREGGGRTAWLARR